MRKVDLQDFNVKNNLTLDRIYHRVNFKSFYDIPDNGHNLANNLILKENELKSTFFSPDSPVDWQLKPGSLALDAGREIPGITGDYSGEAPDAGAYKAGYEPWVPGANWLPDSLPVPESMSDADLLSVVLPRIVDQ